MNTLIAVTAPNVEWNALIAPLILTGGAILTLLVSLLPGRFVQRGLVPAVAAATLIAAGVAFAVKIGDSGTAALSGAIQLDDFTRVFGLIFVTSALVAICMANRSQTLSDFGRGEFYALLISVVLGMTLLVAATNFVTVFLAFELFSLPLYALCASDLRRKGSLESGLKYLIIGSLGSATLLYGMALIYGATGSGDFSKIASVLAKGELRSDALLLAGVALTFVGIAYKASIAPFHQWSPDVYQGAPTPVTAFMAVATKAAAFALLLRFCISALAPIYANWQAPLAALAVVTIVIGNLGALRQTSLKRMLAYSGVAQAGYLLVGVVVATAIGVHATVFYLLAYLLMNIAPFAVIAMRERQGAGDSFESLRGLGREAPLLAWPMTISMLALSGLPVTAGFIGKIVLILAAVDGDFWWLAVVVVLGSALSLVYYLRVIATLWMTRPLMLGSDDPAGLAPAGAAPEADASKHPELIVLAVLAAAATVILGVWPEPLFDLARDAASGLLNLPH
jgi:NADH-quinone oxidoreductase subunit N